MDYCKWTFWIIIISFILSVISFIVSISTSNKTTQPFTVTDDRKLIADPEERKYLINHYHKPQSENEDEFVNNILDRYSKTDIGHKIYVPLPKGAAPYYRYSGISGMTKDEFNAFKHKLQNCNDEYPNDIEGRIRCDGFQYSMWSE
jgi:hypothetical protein